MKIAVSPHRMMKLPGLDYVRLACSSNEIVPYFRKQERSLSGMSPIRIDIQSGRFYRTSYVMYETSQLLSQEED